MRTRELARRVGVSESSIHYWVKGGHLPIASVRPSGVKEFDDEAVERGRAIVAAGGLARWRQKQTALLTSADVVGQTALTYRRLDYWVHAGLVTPAVDSTGSGTQRLWSPSVIDEITELLDRIALCPFGHPEV